MQQGAAILRPCPMPEPDLLLSADTPLPCDLCASPNHGDRRGRRIDSVILHYTGMPTGQGALDWLCNPASEVSSHYFIDEAGGILQLVGEERRAWHAGRSFWRGERDMNSVSIGIEIANPGHDGGLPPFAEAQIESVIALCRDIADRHGIAADRILAHSDIAPDRKVDPGESFPWQRLAEAGLGLWPQSHSVTNSVNLGFGAVGCCIAAMQRNLAFWGLDIAETAAFDRASMLGILAFQRHFRANRVDGVADAETLAILESVAGAASPSAPQKT
jgi:N-acetylmuramoyl-L-alanine amidase